MKEMVIYKSEAQPLVEFLQKVELKNKVARSRSKLVKVLSSIVTELDDDRIALCKEHATKDEDGEAITVDGQYDVKDLDALQADLYELYQEEVDISVGKYSNDYSILFDYLDSEEFDYPLSGLDDSCYNRLLNIWEDAMEQTEEGAN